METVAAHRCGLGMYAAAARLTLEAGLPSPLRRRFKTRVRGHMRVRPQGSCDKSITMPCSNVLPVCQAPFCPSACVRGGRAVTGTDAAMVSIRVGPRGRRVGRCSKRSFRSGCKRR
jgi:hypothetical protein